jgi:hypothetical protein
MLNHNNLFTVIDSFQRFIHSDKSIILNKGSQQLKCLLEIEGNRLTQHKSKNIGPLQREAGINHVLKCNNPRFYQILGEFFCFVLSALIENL